VGGDLHLDHRIPAAVAGVLHQSGGVSDRPLGQGFSPHLATLTGIGLLVGGWLGYDLLSRSPLAKTRWISQGATL